MKKQTKQNVNKFQVILSYLSENCRWISQFWLFMKGQMDYV